MAEVKSYRWDEVELEQLNPLLTRQFVAGAQAMLARIVLRKGCVVPEHAHANEQISFVLEGRMRFVFGGEQRVVETGGMLVIPGGVAHSAEALEETVNLDVFAPPREDWIAKDDAYLR